MNDQLFIIPKLYEYQMLSRNLVTVLRIHQSRNKIAQKNARSKSG